MSACDIDVGELWNRPPNREGNAEMSFGCVCITDGGARCVGHEGKVKDVGIHQKSSNHGVANVRVQSEQWSG